MRSRVTRALPGRLEATRQRFELWRRTRRGRARIPERLWMSAVILRKNGQSNRSDRSAATQGVLISVYRTLRLRGHDPTKTIASARKTYVTSGQLPPLPFIPCG